MKVKLQTVSSDYQLLQNQQDGDISHILNSKERTNYLFQHVATSLLPKPRAILRIM